MKKKNLNRWLIAAVILIWGGAIGRFVFSYLEAGRDSDTPEVVINAGESSQSVPEKRDSLWDTPAPLTRDPFSFAVGAPPPPPVKESPAVVADRKPALISYRIGGVICNKNRQVVLLEDLSGGGTVFLRPGDTYKRLKVVSVTADKVVIDEDGKTAEHVLPGRRQ